MSIDVKYQIWKFGVIFTDNVRKGPQVGEGPQEKGPRRLGDSTLVFLTGN